jgi:cell division initiation protein
MKVTALEIRSHPLKKSMRGYDVREVESLRELASDALEGASREIMFLEEKVKDLEERLSEHIENETTLKQAITTTQRMAGDIKENARKEAELIIVEAKMRAEEIVSQSQGHATRLQEEILGLKKQRIEFETQIKAVLDFHSTKLLVEEEESRKMDVEADKLRFMPK